jgi:DNA-binding XRE family transcriptional regulator
VQGADRLRELRAQWGRTGRGTGSCEPGGAHRVEHGLSQAELGAKLGVSQPYVARLENDDQPPTLATLARLAQRLGLEFPIDAIPTNVRMSA